MAHPSKQNKWMQFAFQLSKPITITCETQSKNISEEQPIFFLSMTVSYLEGSMKRKK